MYGFVWNVYMIVANCQTPYIELTRIEKGPSVRHWSNVVARVMISGSE